jgi:hypothetical protein
MKTFALIGVVVTALSLSACGTTTTSRTVSGAGIGAAGGAAIGAMTGSWGAGAAIGAGVGAVSGYLYDQHKKGNID